MSRVGSRLSQLLASVGRRSGARNSSSAAPALVVSQSPGPVSEPLLLAKQKNMDDDLFDVFTTKPAARATVPVELQLEAAAAGGEKRKREGEEEEGGAAAAEVSDDEDDGDEADGGKENGSAVKKAKASGAACALAPRRSMPSAEQVELRPGADLGAARGPGGGKSDELCPASGPGSVQVHDITPAGQELGRKACRHHVAGAPLPAPQPQPVPSCAPGPTSSTLTQNCLRRQCRPACRWMTSAARRWRRRLRRSTSSRWTHSRRARARPPGRRAAAARATRALRAGGAAGRGGVVPREAAVGDGGRAHLGGEDGGG
jgi:hypothetical protein